MSTLTLDPAIAAFFSNTDASSILTLPGNQITAPIVRGQALTEDEVMLGGGLRIVVYVIDASPSMSGVAKLLLDGFNNIFVPSIKEAREDDVAALRIGGIVFSSDIQQIWLNNSNGFHTLDDLPPLTTADYDPNRGSGTALHRAIPAGYDLGLKMAAEYQKTTGIQPEIDIVVLSDGANNEQPRDGSGVKIMIDGAKKALTRFSFFYFETSHGASQSTLRTVNPVFIAEDLGFNSAEDVQVFAQKPGESEKERRSRFRRMMQVMSKVSATKGMSAVNAAATTPVTADDDAV